MSRASITFSGLLVTSCLFMGASLAAEEMVESKPYWLQENYTGTYKGKTGFVGQSKKWSSQDASSKLRSIDEACKEASHQAAQFFRVRVQSTVKSQLEVTGNQYFSRFEKSGDLQTDITLEGVNRSDTYTQEYTDNNYLISYCLIELTNNQIQQTRQRLEKEQQAIDAMITQSIELISSNEFDRAKLSIAQLKSEGVSQSLIDDLQGILEEQQKKALRADLTLSQSRYGVGEYLSFVIASNQDAYVYVFLEGFKTTKLLFPSPQSSFNLVVSGEPLRYPLNTQVKEGEAFRIPKSKSKNYQIRMVAATEPQDIDFLNTSFAGYSISEEHSYQQYLADCNLSPRCKVMEYQVNLDTGQSRLEVAAYKVVVNGKASSQQKSKLKKVFKRNNIAFANSGKNLMVEVSVEVAYSERIKADMYIISGELLEQERSGDWNSLSRTRVTGLHDEKKLPSLMSKLYDKLVKKAL